MSDEEHKGVFQDRDGDTSSKRVFGALLILVGGLLLLTVGILALFMTLEDPQTAINAGNTMVIAGAGLLGIGVLEGVGRR